MSHRYAVEVYPFLAEEEVVLVLVLVLQMLVRVRMPEPGCWFLVSGWRMLWRLTAY